MVARGKILTSRSAAPGNRAGEIQGLECREETLPSRLQLRKRQGDCSKRMKGQSRK